jgi:hypothetical protein
MSDLRIEFTERYVIPPDENEVDRCINLKLEVPEGEVLYRRVYVRLSDIFAPMEVPGEESYCELEFTSGYSIFVQGSYDDICQKIDDRKQMDEE